MTNEEYNKIIADIEILPTGGITYKKINGTAFQTNRTQDRTSKLNKRY